MKKKIILSIALILGAFSALAMPKTTCTCTSGDMTVELEGGKVKMTCSGNGRVVCEDR